MPTVGSPSTRQVLRGTLVQHVDSPLVGVSDSGVPGPTSKFVAACPCPDGLARDKTQGKNEPYIILHQGARSRVTSVVRERERESE
jgi:hypothetical protein